MRKSSNSCFFYRSRALLFKQTPGQGLPFRRELINRCADVRPNCRPAYAANPTCSISSSVCLLCLDAASAGNQTRGVPQPMQGDPFRVALMEQAGRVRDDGENAGRGANSFHQLLCPTNYFRAIGAKQSSSASARSGSQRLKAASVAATMRTGDSAVGS